MSSKDMSKLTDCFDELNFNNCQQLANMNDPDGMYRLGYFYEYGIGIEKDENKAFTYYQKSADMNDFNGIYQVGYCYYLGIGVKIDKHKAFKYFLKSAEAGNSMGILKTAICYRYGIGVEESYDKFEQWTHEDPYRGEIISFSDNLGYGRRYSKYGKCSHCNENNTSEAWCLSCDPDKATRWTSGNKDIDDCMKTFQLRAFAYEDAIEWIPFDRLSDVKLIGNGGFGSVYSALWLDGIRKVDGDDYNYVRAREPFCVVALKTLANSMETKVGFLKEFKGLMECKLNHSKLAIYGITQTTETKEFLMVFQFATNGSLYKYLRENFNILTWLDKLRILKDISKELDYVHYYAGYIHADFHSGNILQDQQSYIADLGLSRKKNESVLEGNIYGVMPYVAPEVLSGEQQFTQAADIYGYGIIMAEISTGQRPFDGHKFDIELAVKVCKGSRPEFALGTPKCYIDLAEKCMNSDPKERPNAYDVWKTIDRWLNKIASSNDNEIKRQFLDADKVIKPLPIPKHPDEMYTSKLISTKLISEAIKDLYQVGSVKIDFNITEL